MNGAYVSVERNTFFFRLWHWINFVLGMLVLFTGIEIYAGGPYWNLLGSFHTARAFHVLLAFAVAFWALPVLFYYLVATRDIRWFLPTRDDMSVNTAVLKNFFGLSKTYPEYGTYDIDFKDWFRKYNPGQKLRFYADTIALLLSGLTGLALYAPNIPPAILVTSFVSWVGLGGIAGVRSIHYFILYYYVFTVTGHVYLAACCKMNREVLKSIFTGTGRFSVHRHIGPKIETRKK